jgi:hypothetical protein
VSPRRRSPGGARIRSFLGVALAPSAVAVVFAAVAAVAGLANNSHAAKYFLGAFAVYSFFHGLRILTFQRLYVFAHEFTHALAAWSTGGKVFSFVVRGQSGHVDLSHSNTYIALAPYCFPLYSLLCVAAYRLVLFYGPELQYAREGFLALMGATLAFHFAHTIEALWTTHQSDLDEAGFPLSMSLIVLFNGCILLGSVKCLFPALVSLPESARYVSTITGQFWSGLWGLVVALAELAMEKSGRW